MKKVEALGGHPIAYCVIPDSCEAIVTYGDTRNNRELNASIESEFGRVTSVKDATYIHDPKIFRTLEELKAEGITHIELRCRHIIDVSEGDAC